MRNTPFSGESTDSSDNESSCGDYCTPPDELSPTKDQLISKQAKDGLEETTQVLKTCATYTTVSLKKVRDLDFKLSVFILVLLKMWMMSQVILSILHCKESEKKKEITWLVHDKCSHVMV